MNAAHRNYGIEYLPCKSQYIMAAEWNLGYDTIKTMKASPLYLCTGLFLALPSASQQDARVSDALYRVSKEASGLWQTAPHFIGLETVTQKALTKGKGKLPPGFRTREIVSYYSLGAFKGSREALREFRQIVFVDGKPVGDEKSGRGDLERELASVSDSGKIALLKDFEKTCLAGSATDFGQLILLFTRPNLSKYSFEFAGDARIGVDNAWLIGFKQQTGNESLHISEGGSQRSEKLQGEISVRQGDYLPLRIVLNVGHTRGKNEIRDSAKLDYTVMGGALLPAALVYRRFVNGDLALESIYRYSDWQAAGAP